MKRVITFFTALCALFSQTPAAYAAIDTPESFTSFEAAKKKATDEHKNIVLIFEGSDWCPWCQKLQNEIIKKKELQDKINGSLLIVTVDFPRDKKLDAAQLEENNALKKQFNIRYFPTVIVLDSNFKEIKRLGYEQINPSAYADKLLKIAAKDTQ